MTMLQEYSEEENRYFSLPMRFLFYILFSFISGSICYHYGMHFYIDSDEANYYLAAQDMAHGNFTLKGWVFSPDNFWLIDIIGMAMLIKFGGFGITAPHLMAAIWWAGVTFCALCLANPPQKIWLWVRCLPIILFIAFPPLYEHRPSGFITFVPYHVGTLFYGLCGLIAAQMIAIRKKIVINYLLLCITALPIFTSDFFGVVFYIMPLIVVTLLFRLKGENTVPFKGLITAFGVAFIISEIFKIYVHCSGGFFAHRLHSKFISIENIPSKIIYTMKSLLDFFGVNFFGHKIINSIPDLIKLIPFSFIFLFFYKKINHRKEKILMDFDYISSSLFLGGTIIFFASIFSDFYLYKEDIIRYLLPFFTFYILIYARNSKVNRIIFLIPCFLISMVYILTWSTITNTKNSFKDIFGVHHQIDTAYIEEKLKENNLRLGYAGYWEASVVTANSQGKFFSRAVKINEKEISNPTFEKDKCKLSPYIWISKLDWYKKSNFDNEKQIFFIAHAYGEKHDSWLLQDNVINSLGNPDKIINLGNNLYIDVYNTDRVFACKSLYTWEKNGKKVYL